MSRRLRSAALRSLAAICAALLCAAVVPAPPVASAVAPASLYVAVTGSDTTGDGTQAKPLRTITKAITSAVPDQTVIIGPGTYNAAGGEALPLQLKGGVTLRSSGGRLVTKIDGGGSPSVVEIREFIPGTVLTGLTITGGQANAMGGGVYMALDPATTPSPGYPMIIGCDIVGNQGPNGGGIFVNGATDKQVSPRINSTMIRSNSATNGGGVIVGSWANPWLYGCMIEQNTASSSGGGISASGSIRIEKCTIRDNEAATDGGGIRITGGTNSFVRQCVVSGNTADGGGGGIFSTNSLANLEVTDTYVVENTGKWGGGVFFGGGVSGPTRTFTNCVVADNVATTDAGAFLLDGVNGVDMGVVNCTVAGNTSPGFDGLNIPIDILGSFTVSVKNSIFRHGLAVAGNEATAEDFSGFDVDDSVVWSNVRNPGYGDWSCIHADPLFAGPDVGDYRLRLGSPSIDRALDADAPAADVDGIARPQEGDDKAPPYPDQGAYERSPAGVVRTAGQDRYETACAISRSQFGLAGAAIVASGENFPDALSASGLAGVNGAPLLLVTSKSVPKAVHDTMSYHGVIDVIIVGGPSAVSEEVAQAFRDRGKFVTRIAGDDRYETSAAVAREIARYLRGLSKGTAFVARGDSFPDALAVGPLAYRIGGPVLLTQTDKLPAATKSAIQDLGVTDVVVAGGTGAVSQGVFNEIDAVPGVTAVRKSGSDRYSTAAAVARYGIAEEWCGPRYVGMATGAQFPDALAGGAAAGQAGGVLLLTSPTALPGATGAFLNDFRYRVMRCDVYGGSIAVSNGVKDAIDTALGW